MFENLSEKLQRVFKNLRGEGKLTAENMEQALREIRVALLEADVHFRVVKQLIESVKQKAMGEEVLTALSPAQQVIKIVHEELVSDPGQPPVQAALRQRAAHGHPDRGPARLGQDHHHRQTGALAQPNGHSPLMVSVDVYRPAAREQLSVIARDIEPAGLRGYAGGEDARRTGARGAARGRADRPRRAAGGYGRAGCTSTTS